MEGASFKTTAEFVNITEEDAPLSEASVTSVTSVTEDGFVVDVETGEIISSEFDTRGGAQQRDLADWVEWALERRARLSARAAGLERERSELLKKINDHYDGEVRRLTKKADYIEKVGAGAFRSYLDIFAKKGQKSVSTPWGTIKLRSSRARVDVLDAEKLVAWLESKKLWDAVKIKKEPLKSAIPEGEYAHMPEDAAVYIPAGVEERLEIE